MTTFRDNLLAGKTAFVAGASSGINLQIATRLAQAGAAVTILSRSPDKIEAAAAGHPRQGRQVHRHRAGCARS
jgi:NAD(P)-dependent dehydrogenase (short-subunit alcohol dehydrogenase family)